MTSVLKGLTTSFLMGIKYNYFSMCYNWYLYQLSVQAVLITNIIKNGISAVDIIADLIIGTSITFLRQVLIIIFYFIIVLSINYTVYPYYYDKYLS